MTGDEFTRHVARSARWSLVLSVLTAAVGVFMIVYSLMSAAVSTAVFGGALIIAAVAQLLFTFTCESAGHFVATLLLGTIYGVSGLLVIAFPAAGVPSLTGVLG